MYRAFISGGDGGHSSSRRNSFANATSSPSSLKNAIGLTIGADTFLWLMRRLLRHFVFSKTPKLRDPAYDAVNTTLYCVYASLTVGLDIEPAHLNDMFAGREKRPFVSVESFWVWEYELGVLLYL